jgi:hypothetical protein
MIIAALDIETLDTAHTAHVFEISAVTAVIDVGLFIEQSSIKLAPNYLEQLFLGRTKSKDTLEFHRKIRGNDEFESNLLSLNSNDTYDYTSVSLVITFELLRDFLKDVEEIWINGLSFDSPILHSLAKDSGCSMPLWDFRKERDVRTVRNTNPALHKLTKNTQVLHSAYEDALWNLSVAAHHHNFMAVLQGSLEPELAPIKGTSKSKSKARGTKVKYERPFINSKTKLR